MTDPNVPPPERPEVVHHTTINNPPERRGGGGSWIAFLVGGLVVVVAIIAVVIFANGGASVPTPDSTDVNVDIDLPRPNLPDAPKMPDLPSPPPIEPPSVPDPAPAPAPAQPTTDTPAPPKPDPGLIRLQILLDRSTFSPGIVDGLAGENTRQAIVAYRQANDLGDSDAADAALLQHLTAADTGPVTRVHTLTAEDVAGPFSPASSDLEQMAANGTHFTTVKEKLAERFHMTEGLLDALNPGVALRAGQRILVPAVSDAPIGEVARIVIDKTERSARAFDASGKLLAFYPATIGSTERPAPTGTLRVVGIAPAPNYTYDPDRVSYDRGDKTVVVPAGPNNPVGSVWIGLNRQSYGIHGTPDPSKIAKTASNGCIRMTNWDAEQLAASVKAGVEVEFT
ncbi:L,D-transpeptidase [uncultured Brevundimonas sp.]|uniref:L,D-transpeptidase family protein n=1 Tax=uncultured Brevundimonas sp. TaxID=213418 RepID=UPI0025E552CC|nr:L,D-transpeptidase [uncultured Brevundimonas sp.]